ncbi:uncharacterized protein TNIN_370292 [Trichonephila inaurata madagascariensis]|uniref:Uncharacterized protein n=1 Tax=Trichonephila inaurata madagascariensis TaxID=2747483 RepID=A0A8X6YRA9_9ARAC|nr:uncharacterized protein TNIN_370292 [Trichonephila inaurata madagascariensis]
MNRTPGTSATQHSHCTEIVYHATEEFVSQEGCHPGIFNSVNENPKLNDSEKEMESSTEEMEDMNSESTPLDNKTDQKNTRFLNSYRRFYGQNPNRYIEASSEIRQCMNFVCALLLGIVGFCVFFTMIDITLKSNVLTALTVVFASLKVISKERSQHSWCPVSEAKVTRAVCPEERITETVFHYQLSFFRKEISENRFWNKFYSRVYRIVRDKENNVSLKGDTPLTELTYELVPEDELYSTNCSSASEPHCMHCANRCDNRINSPVISEQGSLKEEYSSWSIKPLIKLIRYCLLLMFSLQIFLLRKVFKHFLKRN